MRYEINIDIHSITYNKDISIGFYKPRSISSNSANSASASVKRSVRIVETSTHLWLFMQILVIDLDWTDWNEKGRLTVCRFGISIQYSIIQYQTRKSYWIRIFETTINRSDGY